MNQTGIILHLCRGQTLTWQLTGNTRNSATWRNMSWPERLAANLNLPTCKIQRLSVDWNLTSRYVPFTKSVRFCNVWSWSWNIGNYKSLNIVQWSKASLKALKDTDSDFNWNNNLSECYSMHCNCLNILTFRYWHTDCVTGIFVFKMKIF